MSGRLSDINVCATNEAALYNEIYQYGYDVACKNRNAELAKTMYSKCKMSNETRYYIACKHDFDVEIKASRATVKMLNRFVIACESGNINEAFDIYEQNMDEIHACDLKAALHAAHDQKHYPLILKFVKIYNVNGATIVSLIRKAISDDGDGDHAYIDELISYIKPMEAFQVACDVGCNRITDYLLKSTIDKRQCFIHACLSGNSHVVKQLRWPCCWHYNVALDLVCSHTKHINIVELLVDYGADNIAECKTLAESKGFDAASNFFKIVGF